MWNLYNSVEISKTLAIFSKNLPRHEFCFLSLLFLGLGYTYNEPRRWTFCRWNFLTFIIKFTLVTWSFSFRVCNFWIEYVIRCKSDSITYAVNWCSGQSQWDSRFLTLSRGCQLTEFATNSMLLSTWLFSGSWLSTMMDFTYFHYD